MEIPDNFYDKPEGEVALPTFICSCGEEVIDIPANRLLSEMEE